MTDGGHTIERLRELQSLPLERKVGFTAARITEWYSHWNGKVYVSFSGGKDSTVLLHLVRSLFPDVKAVFIDTGLEYPETKKFVKLFDNVEIIHPPKTFKQVIDERGYPIISKNVAMYIEIARNYFKEHGTWGGGAGERLNLIPRGNKYSNSKYDIARWGWLVNAPFKISDSCCYFMKKKPMKKYEKESGLKPFIGTLAEESQLRETAWILKGCNAFDAARPTSTPLSFWTEQDVLKYIKLKNIPICPVYGEIVEYNGKLQTTGVERTGCLFCLFGITGEKEPNRIQRLAITHPNLWKYCVYKLGLKEVMEFLKVPYAPQVDLFNIEQVNKIEKQGDKYPTWQEH